MSTLAAQAAKREANDLTLTAGGAGGDEFVNTGKELLLVLHTNSGGSTVTLTIGAEKTVDGLTVPDKTIDIAAGKTALLGPWPTDVYNDGDGKVQLSWSDETDIEAAVVTPS